MNATKRKIRQDLLALFRQVGTSVEHEWRDAGYDATRFPKIAATALKRIRDRERIDPIDVIRSIGDGTILSRQYDVEGSFSSLPITVFSSTRFYIDVYFWLDGTTSIHQHGFAGAFQVLTGSSLHSHYEFRSKRDVSPHFSVGNLSLKRVQLLSQGDIREIVPGKNYIHSLFHLDRPSTTITIRTIGLPTAQPQFNYLKPGVAYDPFFTDPAMMKRIQSVNVLLGTRHPEAEIIIKRMLADSDLHTTFVLLDAAYSHLCRELPSRFGGVPGKWQHWNNLLTVVRKKHGSNANIIAQALSETRKQMRLIERRSAVTTPELRFFLALLLNIEGSKRILKLVQQRYPDNSPVETVLNWIEELSRIRLADGNGSSALGIDGFDDLHLLVTESLVKRKSLAETQADLRKIFRNESPRSFNQKIKARYLELERSSILQPLFAAD